MSELLELLTRFVTQAHEEGDLSTKHYPKAFRELKSEVSFGYGNRADVAWLSFFRQDAWMRNQGQRPA